MILLIMSYYRFITRLYKSDLRGLNRTLRSSSVPRHLPDLETGRRTRACSVPPSAYYSNAFMSHPATPFADRARSVPRELTYSYRSSSPPRELTAYSYRSSSPELTYSSSYSSSGGYSDLDCKVLDYMNRLDREDTIRSAVSQTRNYRSVHDFRNALERDRVYLYPSDSFAARYNYYDGNKHERDYMYPMSRDLLGSWKHSGLSADTLNLRNARAKSPLQSRELDRYYETKKYTNYVGDISSGGAVDFRHYNYRRVPYFGGSDNYQYMRAKPGRLYTRL